MDHHRPWIVGMLGVIVLLQLSAGISILVKIMFRAGVIVLLKLSAVWTAVELHRILSKYGKVIDVFIPSKRTKSGKRFSFVRFRACHDIQRLILSINRIKVGNGFLQALIARSRVQNHQNHPSVSNNPTPPISLTRTFADTVIKNIPPQQPTPSTLDKATISFSPLQTETEWLSSCAFGVLSELMNTQTILQLFLQHGLSVTVSDFGGISVIVKFPSPKELNSFFASNQHWSDTIFDLLRPWQPKDGPSNRKVWIRARGIPLHAWSHGFFHTLVSRFGSHISVAPETENKIKLDFAVLQVITTVFKPITWEITALINDLSYQIIIDEFQQPPLGAVPFTTSPYFAKSLSNSPTVSKPLLSPLTSNPSAAAQSGDVTGSSSGQHTSDPFKLMSIIVNTTKPMNGHACPDVLTPQSGFVAASNNANSSCGLSTANLLVGSTNTTRTCKSPCISYSDSSSPNTHACSHNNSNSSTAFIYLPSYFF
ncbi:hypothetical protein Tsubulata_048700 [Turnera subulata]|uniref:RRM domain-containing protein n=1 Tax=Turnera subulata TaxID=218843 RepID=A0A9Q0JCG4_9ROSI|nr:hypothetical protein Tsubulata_048700 [Turnera subulata]